MLVLGPVTRATDAVDSLKTAIGPLQNRDYPVLNEYRSMLGGLFARLYGLSERDVQRVFPGAVPRELGIV